MKSSEILYQMRELQQIWRDNNFVLNEGQKVTYDRLLQLRRERVKFMYDNNMVSKGSKSSD